MQTSLTALSRLRPSPTIHLRWPRSLSVCVSRSISSSAYLNLQPRPGGPRSSRSTRPDRDQPRQRPSASHPPPHSPFDDFIPPLGGGFTGGPGSAFTSSPGGYSSVDPASVPVHIPGDPHGVLKDTHGAVKLLANSALVIVRQLEMLNVFMGFEQANRYAIMSPEGEHVGYIAEEGQTFVASMMRQALRTHRPFRSIVMDKYGVPILWIRRPFAFINSRIFVHAEQNDGGRDGNLVGEAQQRWHLWRRRYDLFKHRDESFKQFARIDSGFWAWDFWLKNQDDRIVASINRNFAGFGRELFTDTGQYVVRFDAVEQELALFSPTPNSPVSSPRPSLIIPPSAPLTLDERAMTLATAVSIDFDYFSRHSGAGGMGFPFMFWGGGGGSELGGRDGAGVSGAGVGAGAGAAVGGLGDGLGEEDVEGREDGLGEGHRVREQSPWGEEYIEDEGFGEGFGGEDYWEG